MSYCYQDIRPQIFTDKGLKMLLAYHDAAHKLLLVAGAFREQELMTEASQSGDSWLMLACVDYLVEIGEIERVGTTGARQFTIYIRKER